jgi:hypothetical protein
VTDYGQVTVSLEEGDSLYLYTDGLLDLLGGEPAAGAGYLAPVVRFLGGGEVERRFDLLYRERTGKSPLRDDVTLLGMHVRKSGGRGEA